MEPSPYQRAILDWIRTGRGHAAVNACAGSGKTTLLTMCAREIQGEGLFLAFNKHIAEALTRKLRETPMQARTIHSLGFSAVRARFGNKVKVVPGKYRQILRQHWERPPRSLTASEMKAVGEHGWPSTYRLCDLARASLLAPTQLQEIEALVDYHALEIRPELTELAAACVADAIEAGLAEARYAIDYGDMIALPHYLKLTCSTYPWAFVDECVDGSARIACEDGASRTLREIVETRWSGRVASFNRATGNVEFRSVTAWHTVPRRDRRMTRIGRASMTEDHPVYVRGAGYVPAGTAQGEVLELNEDLLHGRRLDATRGVHHSRVASWRCLDRQIEVPKREGATEVGQRAGAVRAFSSSAGLPDLEARGARAVGADWCGESDPYRVRGSDAQVSDPVSPAFHSAVGGVLPWAHPGGRAESQGDPSRQYRSHGGSGTRRLASGRRVNREIERCSSDLRLLARGQRVRSLRADQARNAVQGHGDREGACPLILRGGDSGTSTPHSPTRDRLHAVQASDRGKPHLQDVPGAVSRRPAQPESDVLRLVCGEPGPPDAAPETVYCIDVDGNQNFFANGILVHNCQDLSPAQLDTAMRAVAPGGRVLAVGDPLQSVFGFAGADSQSFHRIVRRLDATVFPLSVCYRCPSSHLELARELCPQIEPAPGARAGTVQTWGRGEVVSKIREGDLVLCRRNAPLLKLCYELIGDGISAAMKGRDIGEGLVKLAKGLDKLGPFDSFGELIDSWENQEIEALIKSGKESEGRIESIGDRAECLRTIHSAARPKMLAELLSAIESLFATDRPSVLCSSVHRAKGLENDRVVILEPDLLRNPHAKRDWQLEQERNLLYVALTRAKETLAFVE